MFPLKKEKVIQDIKYHNTKTLRGIFNQYADNSKIELEDNAWQNYVKEKYKI